MDTSVITAIKTAFLELKKIDIESLMAEAYKDNLDFPNNIIRELSAEGFIAKYGTFLDSVEYCLEQNMFLFVSNQFKSTPEAAAIRLFDGDIVNFLKFLLANNFAKAEMFLTNLICFLLQNGLWHQNSTKEISQESLTRFNLLLIKLEQEIKTVELLKNDIYELYQQNKLLSESQKQDLATIENMVVSSRKYKDEIDDLFIQSSKHNQDIKGFLNNNNEEIRRQINISNDLQERLEMIASNYGNGIIEVKVQQQEFDKLLENVKEKSKIFESKIDELNELLGLEGAKHLFQTFDNRRKELSTPVKRWSWAVVGASIFASFSTIAIFTNFFGWLGLPPTFNDMGWELLFVNSLKSLPLIVLLYFTIRQYIRERKYQEEYAFRSAIALTIRAYGDLVGSKKEELISKAVENIYTMPTMMKDTTPLFGLKSDHLAELLKEIKDIKDKMTK